MSGSQIAAAVFAELLIIATVLAVVFYYMLRKAKQNIAELRAALKINKDNVDGYDRVISRELERTKHRIKSLLRSESAPGEALLVTRLRASFLSAELHARTYRENQEAFWKALEEGLKDMISLAQLKVDKTTGSEREAWQRKLEQSERKVAELELGRGTFSAPLMALGEAQAQSEELEQLRELNAQHVDKIEKLINDIAELRSASIHAELPAKGNPDSKEIDDLIDNPPKTQVWPASGPVFIRSVQEVKYAQAAMADTFQQIDTYQSNSTRELGRLKEMCLEQRTVIKDLRKQLKLANSDASPAQAEQAIKQADNIDRLLRDAEMCVMTLEQENANLHSEISTLRSQANVPDKSIFSDEDVTEESDIDVDGEKSLAYHRKQVQQFRDRIQQQDQVNRVNQQLRYFIAKAMECQTDKALLELLTLTLSQLGLSGCLQLKDTDRTLSATFGHNTDNRDSNLLNSIVVDAAVTPLEENTIYALKPIKILIKQNETSKQNPLSTGDVLEIAEVAARQLNLLASKEKQLIDSGAAHKIASAVKKALNNINIQLKYHGDESKRVAETLTEDLKIATSVISLSDQEEQRLLAIIDQAEKRLDILVTNGSLIEKSISGLLNSVDDMARQS